MPANPAPRDVSDPGSLLVPEGTTVLHIGPPKTATTALQGSFFTARERLEEQGVHYAGKTRHSAAAVLAGIGRPGFFAEGTTPATGKWDRLVDEITSSPAPRVVVSSEFFADAESDQISRIAKQLARPRTLIRSAVPARLSSAFHTRSPLCAQACLARGPKNEGGTSRSHR